MKMSIVLKKVLTREFPAISFTIKQNEDIISIITDKSNILMKDEIKSVIEEVLGFKIQTQIDVHEITFVYLEV